MVYTPLNTVKNVFSAEALTVSGGATPSATSDAINVSKAASMWFSAENTGDSTDLTVILYGASSATSTVVYPVATLNLDGTTTDGAKYIEFPPSFVIIKGVNGDESNATTFNADLDIRR